MLFLVLQKGYYQVSSNLIMFICTFSYFELFLLSIQAPLPLVLVFLIVGHTPIVSAHYHQVFVSLHYPGLVHLIIVQVLATCSFFYNPCPVQW